MKPKESRYEIATPLGKGDIVVLSTSTPHILERHAAEIGTTPDLVAQEVASVVTDPEVVCSNGTPAERALNNRTADTVWYGNLTDGRIGKVATSEGEPYDVGDGTLVKTHTVHTIHVVRQVDRKSKPKYVRRQKKPLAP